MATIGEMSIGDIVSLKVDGAAKDFIVVHQGLPSSDYDSSCNGTWLLMKDIYINRAHGSCIYPDSTLYAYLQNTFFPLLDEKIQSAVKEVKLPYTPALNTDAVNGANGVSAKIFDLSCAEVNITRSDANVEGAVLDYFNGAGNSKRIAYYNGTAGSWYTRTCKRAEGYICTVYSTGAQHAIGAATGAGVRPAFILPSDMSLSTTPIIGNVSIGEAWKELSAAHANIGGVWKEILSAYTNVNGIWKPMS